ncbi:DNA-binding response regulator [Putridiphycobacter roseus]|uniref:DNA-binding response regulator n=1 Tax=Putridiphycobacter roseus TaxID=2219161 RepID=A0A2W1N3W8_9FLAO|nr:response regulator transcription factor [Putridiphycobacter roseus]PZE18280.1 DNA-binding response regulator [Putridiphycobacter roseus]
MNILFADDHHLILSGLQNLLSVKIPNATFLTCDNKTALFSTLSKEKIDILLLDIKFGKDHAKTFINLLIADYPAVKVIMLSSVSDESTILYFNKRTHGYILKTEPFEEITKGIEMVINGQQYISQKTQKILKAFTLPQQLHFTNRELGILKEIMQEKSTNQIAETLNISVKTVEMHKHNIYIKLDVKNITGLVKKVIALGLIEN